MTELNCPRCLTPVSPGRFTWVIVALRFLLCLPLSLVGGLIIDELLPIRYRCPHCGNRFRD